MSFPKAWPSAAAGHECWYGLPARASAGARERNTTLAKFAWAQAPLWAMATIILVVGWPSTAAAAQEAEQALAQVRELSVRLKELERDASRYVGEAKLYKDQLQSDTAKMQQLKPEFDRFAQMELELNEGPLARFNANCGGRELPNPVYQRCLGEKQYIVGKQHEIQQGVAGLQGLAQPIMGRVERLTKAIETTEAKQREIEGKIKDAQEQLAGTRNRLERFFSQHGYVCSCPSSGAAEEMHNCLSACWDNAQYRANGVSPRPGGTPFFEKK